MSEVPVYHDDDADLQVLKDRLTAIIGYGAQGRAQALNLRDSGVRVIVGVRPGKSFDLAVQDGFETVSVREAARRADIIHILLPDEIHGDVYNAEILPELVAGNTICVSHGFSIAFGEVNAPKGVNAIMVAPKGPGNEVRKLFIAGFSTAGLVAVEQDATGDAWDIAMAIAKAEGLTRAGVIKCTMKQEACCDLFGEQNVLCGGMTDLMKYAFEVLTEAGYPPEIAYFECIHEVKLVTDLVHNGGLTHMNEVISNTAEWGEYVNGPFVFNAEVKERMRQSLRHIENGDFARDWLRENRSGKKVLSAKRAETAAHPAEITGAKVRKIFNINKNGK